MRIAKDTDPDLMEWFIPWLKAHEETNLIYYKAAEGQIMFVRDKIAPLVLPRMHYDLRPEVDVLHHGKNGEPDHVHQHKRSAYIVSTHRSKSCEIPVYCFERPDLGLQLVMRGNFYNWKLSVLSENPIEVPQLEALCYTEGPPEPDYTGDELHPVYFEGFDNEWCFRYYADNHRKFSVELGGQQELWTTIFLIMHSLGTLPKRVYNTRAEHRAELDESSRISKEAREKRFAKEGI